MMEWPLLCKCVGPTPGLAEGGEVFDEVAEFAGVRAVAKPSGMALGPRSRRAMSAMGMVRRLGMPSSERVSMDKRSAASDLTVPLTRAPSFKVNATVSNDGAIF